MFKCILYLSLVTNIFYFRKATKKKDSKKKVFGHSTLMNTKNLQTEKSAAGLNETNKSK